MIRVIRDQNNHRHLSFPGDPVLDVCVREPIMDLVLDVCVREPIMDPVLDVCVRDG